ncbi:O-antigen ligase family protein [Aureimonas frigidaquae]|uniref:O-antigen ligase family protein n=1 Tax=Aureimonas frigidaquae TaxID=424757 RepID=UPI000780610A|nr:O-antigen ligase family protein [Aureimonas frigidaquae]
MSFKRFMLLRRRVDPIILALAMALIGILISLGKALFGLLAVSGVVLAVLRPRSWRMAPPVFTGLLAAYCLWSIGLTLLRGHGVESNRILSYASIELACVFLPLGLFLIRRPLDALILGARLGVIALMVATPVEFWLTGMRVGLGRNEAILGFVAGAVGLIARLPMERAPRILPNGRWWLYLSLVPALLSQTRAVWGIYPLMGLFDLYHMWRNSFNFRDRRSMAALALGVCVAGAALVPVAGIVSQRAQDGIVEVERYETTGVASGSVDVRLAMWSAAWDVWTEHPLIGIGHVGKMETVAARAGANAQAVGQYTHLHNLVVDEALNSGLVGLVLLLGTFLAFLYATVIRSGDVLLRETSLVFVFLVFSYGSFHGVLLNEWMVIVIFGFMSIVLTTLHRRDRRQARQLAIGRG